MSGVVCPACKSAATPEAAAEGWCGACGKKLPPFAYSEAGAKPPAEKRAPARPVSHVNPADLEEMTGIVFALSVLALGGATWWFFRFVNAGLRVNDTWHWVYTLVIGFAGGAVLTYGFHRLAKRNRLMYQVGIGIAVVCIGFYALLLLLQILGILFL